MNMNSLKEKVKAKERVIGTLVSLADPAMCEIMGNAGYDCIWVDTEHTYMSYKDVLCHLNAAKSVGCSAIVRLPENDPVSTKKILDMGPDGIIFPMIKSKEHADALISSTLYPPLGTRGFGPLRAIGYGKDSAKEYVDERNFDLCRFVQIEHIDMINELSEIVKNPYIDGFIFGPNDLSASLDEFLMVFEEKTMSKIKEAIKILKDNGKYVGVAVGGSQKEIEVWSSLGFDMLFFGSDWTYLYSTAKEKLLKIKEQF
jgi:2-dehydro-3-deoxyglucarate aldolase/4-hydroxy-2-oxoheptanedioate aldolase